VLPVSACVPAAGFQQLAGGLLSSGQLLPYQESVVVDMLHKEVQRSMENQWQMARLETKRYVHSTRYAAHERGETSSACRQQKWCLLKRKEPSSCLAVPVHCAPLALSFLTCTCLLAARHLGSCWTANVAAGVLDAGMTRFWRCIAATCTAYAALS
jgi:hypothetical protein